MARLLDEQELDRQLISLPGWTRDAATLRRTVEAADVPTAVRLIVTVMEEAEQMNHHPDVDLRWRTVHFALSTHSAGGLTQLDIELAHRIEQAAQEVRGA